MTLYSAAAEPDLDTLLRLILETCRGCRRCAGECELLDRFGVPGDIAVGLASGSLSLDGLPWLCSQCGLCGAVCPSGLDPARLFESLRARHATSGGEPLKRHRTLLNFEARGVSPRYTCYFLPPGATRVFFPGCTLPGARPHTTYKLYELLKKSQQDTGVVLDCCTKPSRLLGRRDFFEAMMQEMVSYLKHMGIGEVLFACPNCYATFREFGPGLGLKTVYEALAEAPGSLPGVSSDGPVTIHDPCVLRSEGRVHEAVRRVCRGMNLELVEMEHARDRTLCCGEGGGVGLVDGGLADAWAKKRAAEAGGRKIVTYCAGCLARLDRAASCLHLLDLAVGEKAEPGRIPRSPVTYLNRLRLKKKILKQAGEGTFRERPRIVS